MATAIDWRIVQQAKSLLSSNLTEQQKGRGLLAWSLCRGGTTCHSMSQTMGTIQALRLEEAVRISLDDLCSGLAAGPHPVLIVQKTLPLNKISKDKTPVYHTDETLKTSFRSQKSRLQVIAPLLDKA